MHRGGAVDRKYIFEYDVGQWLCGTVQVVKERESGELRVCKTVPKSLVNGNGAFDQVRRMEHLKHKHICRVRDVLADPANLYIVHDYCMGGDVGDWVEKLEEGRWLQEQTCAAYIRQLIIALSHSHSQQVYHRDLTPSSLALTSKMPDAEVKVTDLGLAAILDPDSSLARRAQSAYLAPEILSGVATSVTGAADMWSVGAIAHHLLVGCPPSRDSRTMGQTWLDRARASVRSLAGGLNTEDAWAERSAASREFVEMLLTDVPPDRPTAARALHHPWMKSLGPSGSWIQSSVDSKDAAKDRRDNRYKTLCYVLGVLLVPVQVPHRDFEQLRSGFSHVDVDNDGFSPRPVVKKLLQSRCVHEEAVEHAMNIADVGQTGVLDLCAASVADVIAREFFAAGPTSQPLAGPFQAPDLAPRMMKRLMEVYAGKGQMTVTKTGLRGRLRTATSRDLEVCAGVRFEEVLSVLPESVPIDVQTLSQSLQAGGGRGTPLAASPTVEVEEMGSWSVGPLNLMNGLFQNGLFQTCRAGNGYKREDTMQASFVGVAR